MDIIGAPSPSAGAETGPLIVDSSAETFKADVIDASMKQLVLVDFWATWCGPCKALTPTLEKVVNSAGGKVRLVKIDIDKNQMLASQFQIQSVPTVYAFANGRPVDGFMGGLPEGEVRAFVERALKAAGPQQGDDDGQPQMEQILEAAAEALLANDLASAQQLYQMALAKEPGNLTAIAGMAQLALTAGDLDAAEGVLASVPDKQQNDPALAQVKAALALAREARPVADLSGLLARVAADPKDLEARFELAGGLVGYGDPEGAADHLLEIIRLNRSWNDGAARDKLIQLMEAAGLESEFSVDTRRRLSSILFS